MLRRNFDGSDLDLFESSFEVAVARGGLDELDFERDPETSYNPRVARIAQIVFEDGQQSQPESIAAAMLATIADDQAIPESLGATAILAVEVRRLKPSEVEASENCAAAVIFSAAWLDRLRHIHLASAARQNLILPDLLESTPQIAAGVKTKAPRIAQLLEACLQRKLR